jgi:ribonuclease D
MGGNPESRVPASGDKKTSRKEHTTWHVRKAEELLVFAIPQRLARKVELIAEPRIVKAGVGLKDDLRALKNVFPFAENNMLDLGHAARASGSGQIGVRNLAGIFLGFRIPKGAQTSNWAAARLTAKQIAYAAADAWACRELFLRFQGLGMLGADRPRS